MRKQTLTQFQLQIRKWIVKPLSKSTVWLSVGEKLRKHKTQSLVFSQSASQQTTLLTKKQAGSVLSKCANGYKYGLGPTASFLEFLVDQD